MLLMQLATGLTFLRSISIICKKTQESMDIWQGWQLKINCLMNHVGAGKLLF